MNIDWFTFAAQIVNFLILLALLKRFLYGPILKAIADRETEIDSRFAQLGEQQSAAEAARIDYDRRAQELAQTKQQLLTDAAEEVELWKTDHLDEARTEVEASRTDWFMALDRERGQLQADLQEQYQRDGLRMTESVLKTLAGQDVEQLMVDSFINRLRIDTPSDIPLEDGESVTMRSAFELSSSEQQRLQSALATHGFPTSDLQFRVDETLICGIELRTRNHEISWNVRDSLDWLAAELARDLDQTLAIPDGLLQKSEVSNAT